MRIDSIVLHVEDLHRASRFWCSALGYRPREDTLGDDCAPVLVPEHGEGLALTLDTSDRTHLDLRTASAVEQHSEVQRLIALGARRTPWTYAPDASHVVLADPEGNLFCVINTGPGEPTGDPET
ncbi:VOC family protein [Kineococcus sp. SYSU DK005]|uniref:VOC family protein n=1 Tax=Kineococcus sp. SYSU DK005 TaxID=3383126 RepID=UPI003D7F109A